MTARGKIKMESLMTVGARIPAELHRKLKVALAARGESLKDWFVRVALAEVDGGSTPDTRHPTTTERATRQNDAPGSKPAGEHHPGE